MKHDLLISLRKYRPREGHDPLENFITEAFCWILKSYDDFSIFFIDQLFEKMNIEKKVIESHEWSTQENFDGFFPDMLCRFNDNAALVFEHKAWSPLHNDQIKKYMNYAKRNYTESYMVVITATTKQHNENAFNLCWSDIYKLIQKWLDERENTDDFMFNNFLELLRNEGMSPPDLISNESILSYVNSIKSGLKEKSFTSQIECLIGRIKNSDWASNLSKVSSRLDSCLEDGRTREGRFGIELLSNWEPGVFVGFLLDGSDRRFFPICSAEGLNFCIIIHFHNSLHNTYPKSETYKAFASSIEKQIKALDQDWNFYHHIEDKDARAINKWHPIHIRKPMLQLFKGTMTAEEQDDRFMEAAEQILNIIFKSNEFDALHKECLQLAENK